MDPYTAAQTLHPLAYTTDKKNVHISSICPSGKDARNTPAVWCRCDRAEMIRQDTCQSRPDRGQAFLLEVWSFLEDRRSSRCRPYSPSHLLTVQISNRHWTLYQAPYESQRLFMCLRSLSSISYVRRLAENVGSMRRGRIILMALLYTVEQARKAPTASVHSSVDNSRMPTVSLDTCKTYYTASSAWQLHHSSFNPPKWYEWWDRKWFIFKACSIRKFKYVKKLAIVDKSVAAYWKRYKTDTMRTIRLQ